MDKKVFSNKVYVYTFILSILVVLVHSVNFAESNMILLTMIQSSDFYNIDLNGLTGAAAHVENFLSNAVGQAAVPGFFMMSGYLFFRNSFSLYDIGRKWRRRIESLVLPYFAWNFIYYIIYLICGKASANPQEFYEAIVRFSYNHVFWYVQQLILLTVLAPVFYYLLKGRGTAILSAFVFVIFVLMGKDIPYINEDAVLYYFTGAFLALYYRTFFESEEKDCIVKKNTDYKAGVMKYVSCRTIAGVLMVILVWASQVFTTVGMQMFFVAPVDIKAMDTWKFWFSGGYVSALMASFIGRLPALIPVGILSAGGQVVVNVVRRLLLCLAIWFLMPEKPPAAKNYMKNGFFLYAIHYPIARVGIYMLEYMNVGYHNAVEQSIRLTVYLMTPVMCVIFAYIVKKILEKYTPFIWRILSGGR